MTEQVQQLINNYPNAVLAVIPNKYDGKIDLSSLSIQAIFSNIEFMQLFDVEDKLLALFNLIE